MGEDRGNERELWNSVIISRLAILGFMAFRDAGSIFTQSYSENIRDQMHGHRMKSAALKTSSPTLRCAASCRTQKTPASRVLREFMREYVAEHTREVASPRGKRGAAFSCLVTLEGANFERR
jgi:hypothetical protein